MTQYHIIVIGAGSGGLVVASAAASLGAKVALIEGHKMGGDCLNFGCVPSKAIIKSAKVVSTMKRAEEFGIKNVSFDFDWRPRRPRCSCGPVGPGSDVPIPGRRILRWISMTKAASSLRILDA